MRILSSILLLVLATTTSTRATWLEDYVSELPDYGPTPTPHFSGYLDASGGCDVKTNGPLCQLHYWLALADTPNPSEAPVVLWLNGGPGSSSILGWLQELGPLVMTKDGGLMENPWAWTNFANVLVLEAPMGVGYSYCSRQRDHGKPCVNTDRYTASASRAALVDFFTHKFPELAQNPFSITGESYGGVYIPTLAQEILTHSQLNLKGIAVGDPCTDNTAQADSMDALWYARKYGLVDQEIADLLWEKCDVRLPNLMSKGGISHVVAQMNQELLLIADLEQRRERAKELYYSIVLNDAHGTVQDSQECTLALRKFMLSSSRALSQSWKDLFIDDYSLFAPVSDLEDEQMATYMSRADVRKALHVQNAPTTTWPGASVGFDYTKEYDACNENVIVNKSMIDIYREIVPQLDRTWIYNGDTDPCVSYEGTRLAVKQIQLDELDGGSYRPWFYNQTGVPLDVLATKAPLFGPNLVVPDMGAQMGGHVVDYYQSKLAFVTFHGSGHMVPQFRPQAAAHFLQSFLEGQPLSPLLPNNATLVGYQDDDFRNVMNDWTEKAMGPPFVRPAVVKEEDYAPGTPTDDADTQTSR